MPGRKAVRALNPFLGAGLGHTHLVLRLINWIKEPKEVGRGCRIVKQWRYSSPRKRRRSRLPDLHLVTYGTYLRDTTLGGLELWEAEK